jgi:hypothetical protein
MKNSMNQMNDKEYQIKQGVPVGPFVIPDIYCPFPSQISPYVEEVQMHSLWWVKHFRLVQREVAYRRFTTARFAWLASRVHPLAGLYELSLACDWFVCLFLFDDQFDESELGGQPERMQPILDHLLAVISKPSVMPQGPIAEALADFWQRALSYTPEHWQKRFVYNLASYFDACRWEADNRVGERVPEVDIYMEKRWESGGMGVVFDLIDIAQHVDLPASVYGCEALQTLRRTAGNVVCWANDVYSLHKEIAHGEPNNLVLALQHAHRCNLQEAVNRACAMIADEVHLYMQTERDLPSFSLKTDQDIQCYLMDLRSWMRGNLDWSCETSRYPQVEHVAPEQNTSHLEEILPS